MGRKEGVFVSRTMTIIMMSNRLDGGAAAPFFLQSFHPKL